MKSFPHTRFFVRQIAAVALLVISSGATAAPHPHNRAPIKEFLDDWLPTAVYERGDVVEYRDGSYLSLHRNLNRPPDRNIDDWARLNSPGATGATGPQGPAGPRGPAGARGAVGATGAVGPSGAKGPTGRAGTKGATGPRGPAGPTGPVGIAGLPGAAGPQGPPGARGVAGPPGFAGFAESAGYYDSNGVLVAAFADLGVGLRAIEEEPYSLYISQDDLRQTDASNLRFFFTSSDCSGPRLMFAGSGIYVVGDLAVYSLPSSGITLAHSQEFFDEGQDLSQPGHCGPANPGQEPSLSPVKTLDVRTWGLVPPFSLVLN